MYSILLLIGLDPAVEGRVLLPQGRLGGMKPLVPVGQPRHAPGNVAAMVRRPLQVRQHVGPHKAQLHGAAPLLHPPDAPGPQLLLQAVDDLLQGLHLRLGGGVLPTEGVQSQVRDLLHGVRQHPQLPAVLGGQGNVLVP